MQLEYKDIILRDKIEEDIESHIKYHNQRADYLKYLMPLDYEEYLEEYDEDIYRLTEKKRLEKSLPDLRTGFEIETKNGQHIGYVNSYYIDYMYEPVKKDPNESTHNKAIEIVIFDQENWGKGYGQKALVAFADYLFDEGDYKLLYAKSWSGNEQAEFMCKNLGFRIVSRNEDTISFDGESYDEITLRLVPHNYKRFRKQYEQMKD